MSRALYFALLVAGIAVILLALGWAPWVLLSWCFSVELGFRVVEWARARRRPTASTSS